MNFKNYIRVLAAFLMASSLHAELPNATNNDPYPLYSSVYPYSYLATRQKAHLMRFEYAYPVDRFRISISGFGQFANRARDSERNVINIGDINGRWNMLALFYDPPLQTQLFSILGIPANLKDTKPICFADITDPRKIDPNEEFGFFTIPAWYRKYGARFESEILLIDKCFYSVGLKVQFGIADVRQTVMRFDDLTCQALGVACPTNGCQEDPANNCKSGVPNPPPFPDPTPITPPFTDPNFQAPCPPTSPNCLGPSFPAAPKECITLPQTFVPCADSTCCFSFDCDCKRLVIENIMKQRDLIADFLGLDICNYHKIGVEDLRIDLFWREIFVINQESEIYPRLLFMPFAELGFGIPMEKAKPVNKPFAVPIGNNGHASLGGKFGFTLDFLDTIDLSFVGGFSYFFKQDYCNYRLPTHPQESGIFPYTADVTIRPGPTWFFAAGMHAFHFLDNLSVWAEYVLTSHAQDKIQVCRSFIPSTSNYFKTGFDVELAECFTKWESHLFNIGFNYDLSDHLSAGLAFQIPVRQRNAYVSSMVLGTLTFVY